MVVFIHNTETPKDAVRLLENIACIGWLSFAVCFLWFTLIFTQNKSILKSKFFYLLIFILPVLFIYKQWTNFLIIDYVKQPYGWTFVWSESIWPNLFYIYYSFCVIAGLFLIFNFARKTKDPIKKKQSKIIFLSTAIAVPIGSFTNVLLPELGIHHIPDIADVLGLVWTFSMVYAIAKYKFLTITPALAASNILSTMTDVLILLDPEGNIVTVNKAAIDLLGYKRTDLKGQPFEMLLSKKDLDTTFLAEIAKRATFRGYDLVFKTQDGEDILVNFSNSILKDEKDNVAGIVCIATDITERKKMERMLRKARDELEIRVQERTADLARINQDLHMEIIERKRTEKRLEMLNEELLKTNKKLEQLSLMDIHTGLYNHRYLQEALEVEFDRARKDATPLSVIMMDIDYFRSINDVYGHQFGDLVLEQFAEQLKKMVRRYDIVIRYGGEEFVIILPGADRTTVVILARKLHDAVSLYNFGNAEHTVKLKLSMAVISSPEDEIVKAMDLIGIADQVLTKTKRDGGDRVYSSLDIQKKKPSVLEKVKVKEGPDVKSLQKTIDKLTKQTNEGLIAAVSAFAKTIELKDHYTGEHVERTVHYATEIASSLNLPKDEIERLKQAAILHDLGKIGISEKHLLKDSKLTKEEYDEVKRHPQIGVDIIRPIKILRDIIPLILYHHERWDGKGYPNGLKGEEIPIGARIIAIADVYQALISDRPYRKAYSKQEAIEIIEDGAGSQFDPQIVSLFLKVLEREE